jgi:hypothetical protein
VTYRPIARQQLCKHIPAGTNARNNRTSICGQRISKHASVTIYVVSSAWSVKTVVGSEESTFGTPACQDMSFAAEEFN